MTTTNEPTTKTTVTFNEGHPALDGRAGKMTPEMLDDEHAASGCLEIALMYVAKAVELTKPLRDLYEADFMERLAGGGDCPDSALFPFWKRSGVGRTDGLANDIGEAVKSIDRP